MKNNNAPYLSVIIPAYNEAKKLPLTLLDIDKHFKAGLLPKGKTYEIIVVDNGSTDHTKEITERLAKGIANLKVIESERGKAAAVKKGMLEAKGEICLFMDADSSTAIDQFAKMILPFNEGYAVVIGSRDIEGAKLIPPQPWYRVILGNIGNLIIQALLLPGYWDTQCGFKAFTADAVQRIFPLVKTKKWSFDVELLSLAKKMGYKIKEIPVVWVNNPSNLIKATTYIEFFWEVFKIRYWFWTGKYKI